MLEASRVLNTNLSTAAPLPTTRLVSMMGYDMQRGKQTSIRSYLKLVDFCEIGELKKPRFCLRNPAFC